MGVVIKQIFDQAPATPPKRLFPVVKVQRDDEVMDLNTVTDFSITKSRENIGDSFHISFMGQDEFEYLHPLTSLSEYAIITGYMQGAVEHTKMQVIGIPSSRGQKLVWNNLTTSGSFITGVRKLVAPYAQKIFVDVFLENKSAMQSWDETKPLEQQLSITTASELIALILQDTGISFTYAAYDYKISNYQRNGYPIEIIKDLVDFIGAYMIFDHENGRLEIKDKNSFNGDHYDFLYVDNGDIIELNLDNTSGDFVNAVMVKGILPDDSPEYKDFYDKDAKKEEDKTDEDKGDSGYGTGTDDQDYLIDTIQGTKKAPADPYRKEAPVELIEEKFFNTLLNFDIDPNSIKVEGGSWDAKEKKYAGASFLGYGGFVSSSSVLVTDVNADASKIQTSGPLPPGEGKVGFPWNYEENKDGDGKGEFVLEDQVYKKMTLKGKVVDNLVQDLFINGASVSVDFTTEGGEWQYWKNSASKLVVLFYMPSGTVEAILGNGWTNVTADYPSMEPPADFPKTAITGRGPTAESEESESGVFLFTEIPLSQYTVTVNCVGYDEGELDVNIEASSFDFLKEGNENKDTNAKYKLIDTPYYVVIYGKKAPPISFGTPVTGENADTGDNDGTEQYTEDAKVEPLKPNKNISIDLRSTRGIALAGGRLIYASPITDSRIISEEIAIKAGSHVLIEAIARSEVVKLQIPHNPWLNVGNIICVQSYVKGWTGSSKPLLIVEDISPSYGVSGSEEGIWDIVTGFKKI
jgi:hypothetical protein